MKKDTKSGLLFLAIVAGCLAISVPYRYLHEQSLVDHCLSGEHGSFDYSIMSCDLHENHVYVAYRVRHPRDKSIALIAALFFVLFLSGYIFVRVNSRNA